MAKTAWQSDVPVNLDRSSTQPLSRQIYRSIAEAILRGMLRPGSRLPSARRLGANLGVARNTVNAAYDQLVAEGYIDCFVGSGSRVSQGVPVQPLLAPPAPRAQRRRPRLSPRGIRLTDATLAVGAIERGSEGIGAPALDAFPLETWKRLMARQIGRLSRAELGYGKSAGYAPLRSAIAAYLGRTRNMSVSPAQVVIVAGTQQALDLLARLLLDPGDRVLFENPGYPGARAAFLAADATLSPVPVDAEGMDLGSLPRTKRTARAAYVTPAHQFPLGPTMTLPRRIALMEWAEASNAWVIEDDYDGEFRYAGDPLSAVASLDRSGRVIYVGTFSKVLFPALRIGFVAAPENLARRIASARGFADRHSPLVEQATLAAFIEEGHFARHIYRMRAVYAERRAAVIGAFAAHASDTIDLTVPETGVHVIARLRKKIHDTAAASAARAAGLAAVPISAYCIGAPQVNGLLVSFAGLPAERADGTIREAARAIRLLRRRS